MRSLRFHRDLYPGTAVDEAIKVYEPWVTIEREESASHWIVSIRGQDPALERRVAGELANYALGVTVRRGTDHLASGPDMG